jgi:hypothetical protein
MVINVEGKRFFSPQPSIGVYDYYDKEQRFLLQHQLGKHHECYDQGGDAENYQ